MKLFVDNQIIKKIAHNTAAILGNPLIFNSDHQLSFGWPSLLEYLELGSILSTLPEFNETNPLFGACVKTLYTTEEKEVLYYIYDRLFTEILNQIRNLPQINSSFLLQTIAKQRRRKSFLDSQRLLASTLVAYETAFLEKEAHTMHDLILYLAWDRMCIYMACLFNYQSNDSKFINGISVLRECLVESFHHITLQARTVPSFYRMLEALFFYEMREENLTKHTPTEWTFLSQSFYGLKDQNELVDFFYIDHAVIFNLKTTVKENKLTQPVDCYITFDSSEKVNLRLKLAQYMMDKLKREVPYWDFLLDLKEITYLKED